MDNMKDDSNTEENDHHISSRYVSLSPPPSRQSSAVMESRPGTASSDVTSISSQQSHTEKKQRDSASSRCGSAVSSSASGSTVKSSTFDPTKSTKKVRFKSKPSKNAFSILDTVIEESDIVQDSDIASIRDSFVKGKRMKTSDTNRARNYRKGKSKSANASPEARLTNRTRNLECKGTTLPLLNKTEDEFVVRGGRGQSDRDDKLNNRSTRGPGWLCRSSTDIFVSDVEPAMRYSERHFQKAVSTPRIHSAPEAVDLKCGRLDVWRTLPMPSELDRYLSHAKFPKARHGRFSSSHCQPRICSTDGVNARSSGTGTWRPSGPTWTANTLERQKMRYGATKLWACYTETKHSLLDSITSRQAHTDMLHSQLKTMLKK